MDKTDRSGMWGAGSFDQIIQDFIPESKGENDLRFLITVVKVEIL